MTHTQKETEMSQQVYWQCFQRYLGKIVIATLLSLVATLLTFAAPHVLSKFVDLLSDAHSLHNLLQLIALWFAISVVSYVVKFIAAFLLQTVKSSTSSDMMLELARKLANASSQSVSQNPSAKLVEATCDAVNNFLNSIQGIYNEIFALILGIAALIYSAFQSWQLFVLFLFSFAIILVIHNVMVKQMVKSMSTARDSSASTKNLYLQIINAFTDIKVQGLTKGLKPFVSESILNTILATLNSQKLLIRNDLVSGLLTTLFEGLFLVFATILVLENEITYPCFLAIYMYKGHLYGLANTTLKLVKNKAEMATSLNRMNILMKDEGVSRQHWGNKSLSEPPNRIIIKDLCVQADNGFPIISNLSTELQSGNYIGIVGTSGCGKSTLLRALTCEMPYSSGSIRLGDVELSDLNERSLRRAISLAPQNPSFFGSLTIRQNLTLGNPAASIERIWECIRMCAADDFITCDSDLNKKPENLSGGQLQRLALVRAALHGGKFILMDESTAALDAASQERVIQSIHAATAGGHTVVFVAHRVHTLKTADKILVMDDGHIVYEGTYDDCMKSSHKFRRLAQG